MNDKLKENVPYIVYESSQTRLDRIIKRLTVALVIAIFLMFASNGIWLWAWSQYDYTNDSIAQEGVTNIIGDDNEVQNGD